MTSGPPPLPNQPPPLPQSRSDNRSEDYRRNVAIVSAIVVALFLLLLMLVWPFARGLQRRSLDGAGGIANVESQGGGQLPVDLASQTGAQSKAERAMPETAAAVQPRESLPAPHLVSPEDKQKNEPVGDGAYEADEQPAPLANEFAKFPQYEGVTPKAASPLLSMGGENPFMAVGDAESVVFVVDRSGSMSQGRMIRVIAALNEGIEHLTAKQRFLVLFFNDQMHQNPQQPTLMVASEKNKKIASRWIATVKLGSGGTQPRQAMLHAIAQQPERIMILSDGEFSPRDEAVITMQNQQDEMPARIDAIGLAEVVRVLQDMARNNDGVYFQAR